MNRRSLIVLAVLCLSFVMSPAANAFTGTPFRAPTLGDSGRTFFAPAHLDQSRHS